MTVPRASCAEAVLDAVSTRRVMKGERADTKIRDEVFICDPGNDASNVAPILAPEWQNSRWPESNRSEERRQNSANIPLRPSIQAQSRALAPCFVSREAARFVLKKESSTTTTPSSAQIEQNIPEMRCPGNFDSEATHRRRSFPKTRLCRQLMKRRFRTHRDGHNLNSDHPIS
jgi:hypothetical protein